MPAHRAVFNNNMEAVAAITESAEFLQCLELVDPHGNTVLHVAAICGHHEVAKVLLKAGAKVEAKNLRGWTALDDAIALGNHRMAKLLYSQRLADIKSAYKAKKKDLIESMQRMPDYKFQMSWELGSSFFGYLLRRYAPHDIYMVYKSNDRIRVDGTLMGMDSESKNLIPEWKRGHFSLLYSSGAADGTKSRVVVVDHVKRLWADLSDHKKKAGNTTDMEVAMLMHDGAGKTKMKTSELRFKPAKTWTGATYKEKVGDWNTTVFEAQARLVAVTIYKAPVQLPVECTFEEYLELEVPADRVKEKPVDPFSMDALKPKGGQPKELDEDGQERKAAPKKPRMVTSKLWMAEGFPMSLHDLLPIMDIIGHANKHLKKVSGFMRKYGDRELFPVKVQVPLVMTVFAMVCTRQFSLLQEGDPAKELSFYEIRPGFAETSPESLFGVPGRKTARHVSPSSSSSVAGSSVSKPVKEETKMPEAQWEVDLAARKGLEEVE